jgi:hypothetical protein
MPTEEFVMRGQTASGETEVLNFGSKHGYAFRLIDFQLYPSTGIGSNHDETSGTITAGKTAVDPTVPNFNDEGLIACSSYFMGAGSLYPWGVSHQTVVNDTFLITQNLILMVTNVNSGTPVNWQCRFKPVKMSETEMANANLRQFHVFDE